MITVAHNGETRSLFAMAIDTPCIAVCTIDPRCGLCTGCGRTMAEIGRWGGLSPEERLRIMATLPQRRLDAGLPLDPYQEDDVGDDDPAYSS